MGPDQKPEWAIGEDGDTSKNINTETPKTLKEATSYLYFDDMPTKATLGEALPVREAEAKKAPVKAKKVEAKKEVEPEPKPEPAVEVPTHDVKLGAEKTSKSQKVAEEISSSSTNFMEGVDAKFEEFFTAAEPHKFTIVAGVAVAGVVAAAVVLQRRNNRRHKREAELDAEGVAADDEFAPLLIAKKSSASKAGRYGAM